MKIIKFIEEDYGVVIIFIATIVVLVLLIVSEYLSKAR